MTPAYAGCRCWLVQRCKATLPRVPLLACPAVKGDPGPPSPSLRLLPWPQYPPTIDRPPQTARVFQQLPPAGARASIPRVCPGARPCARRFARLRLHWRPSWISRDLSGGMKWKPMLADWPTNCNCPRNVSAGQWLFWPRPFGGSKFRPCPTIAACYCYRDVCEAPEAARPSTTTSGCCAGIVEPVTLAIFVPRHGDVDTR